MFTTPVSLEWQGNVQMPESSFIKALGQVGDSQVTVTFAPLFAAEDIFLINFECTPPPKALEYSFQAINIIVQAFDHYYNEIHKPMFWIYSAGTASQAKLYLRIQQSIHTKRYGYAHCDFDDLPASVKHQFSSPAIAQFISKRV